MTHSLSIPTFLIGLALSGTAFGQVPPSGPINQTPPPRPSVASATTQSSRIRAFNPGLDGVTKSLYLSNGSVVDLPPDLGAIGASIKKGERVSVSGLRSKVNGQTVVIANSVILDGRTFVSRPGGLPTPSAGLLPPPTPPVDKPQAGPRAGLDRVGPRGPEPRCAVADGPMPPPPPDVRAGRPDRMPPPPPPGNFGPQVPPLPPPSAPGVLAPPVVPPPPSDPRIQPESPSAPPPNGPATP